MFREDMAMALGSTLSIPTASFQLYPTAQFASPRSEPASSIFTSFKGEQLRESGRWAEKVHLVVGGATKRVVVVSCSANEVPSSLFLLFIFFPLLACLLVQL